MEGNLVTNKSFEGKWLHADASGAAIDDGATEATVEHDSDEPPLSLAARLREGVVTGAGTHVAQVLSVEHWDDPKEVKAYLAKVKKGLPSEYNQTDLQLRGYLDVFDATHLSTVTLTVQEGKYRMVRRMLANCGHPVVSLQRTRLGRVTLGDDLPEGASRPLTATELKWAEALLSSTSSSSGDGKKKKKKPYISKRQRMKNKL